MRISCLCAPKKLLILILIQNAPLNWMKKVTSYNLKLVETACLLWEYRVYNLYICTKKWQRRIHKNLIIKGRRVFNCKIEAIHGMKDLIL